MGNYSELKTAISNAIKSNGNGEITGEVLQSTLLSMVNTIGNNASFAGIATPSTNPGTVDQKVFYIATKNGTYPNFSGLTVSSAPCLLYQNNGVWTSVALDSRSAILNAHDLNGTSLSTSAVFNSLADAIKIVPSPLRALARGIVYRTSAGVRLAFFNRDAFVSGWENPSNWVEILPNAVFNVNAYLNTNNTQYTLEEAVEAVPTNMRPYTKAIMFWSSNGVNIAFFNSNSYVSGWSYKNNWFVLDAALVASFIKFYEHENLLSAIYCQDLNGYIESVGTKSDNIVKMDIPVIFYPLYISQSTGAVSAGQGFSGLFKVGHLSDTATIHYKFFTDSYASIRLTRARTVLIPHGTLPKVGLTVNICKSFNDANCRGNQAANETDYDIYLYCETDSTKGLANIDWRKVLNTFTMTTKGTYLSEYRPPILPIITEQCLPGETQLALSKARNISLETLGGLPSNQGATNAGKVLIINEVGDIVPQAIPSGVEPLIPLKASLVRGESVQIFYKGSAVIADVNQVLYGNGWSGNFDNGFTCPAGTTEDLQIPVNVIAGRAYLLDITVEGDSYEDYLDTQATIGAYPYFYLYNGTYRFRYGLRPLDNGPLKIKPYSSKAQIIKSIALYEICSEAESTGSTTITTRNVRFNSDAESSITGFWNIAIGSPSTFDANENGSRNVAIGHASLHKFKTGTRNVGVGTFSMSQLEEGENNVAIGADALFTLRKGNDNIGIGLGCLNSSNAIAYRNIAIGTYVAGLVSGGTVEDNVFIGHNAARVNQKDCKQSVVIGAGAGKYVGDKNVFIGCESGFWAKGSRNTMIGFTAGDVYVDNDQCTFIGNDAGAALPGSVPSSSNTQKFINCIAIGSGAKAIKNNQTVIGNNSTTETNLFGDLVITVNGIRRKLKFDSDGTVKWQENS